MPYKDDSFMSIVTHLTNHGSVIGCKQFFV